MIRFLFFCLSLIFLSQSAHSDGYERLLYLKNFKTLSERACEENKIMVVMISRESCPYCIKLKKQIFMPEVKNGELNSKWLLRELLIDSGDTHRNFNGVEVDSVEYARSINATLTPSVLFLGPNGKELGKRIVGTGGAIDFYSFYLKRSINEAFENLDCSQ